MKGIDFAIERIFARKMCYDENSKRESHLKTMTLTSNELIKSLDDGNSYKCLGILQCEKVFCYKMKESVANGCCLRAVMLKSKRNSRNAVAENIPG